MLLIKILEDPVTEYLLINTTSSIAASHDLQKKRRGFSMIS